MLNSKHTNSKNNTVGFPWRIMVAFPLRQVLYRLEFNTTREMSYKCVVCPWYLPTPINSADTGIESETHVKTYA